MKEDYNPKTEVIEFYGGLPDKSLQQAAREMKKGTKEGRGFYPIAARIYEAALSDQSARGLKGKGLLDKVMQTFDLLGSEEALKKGGFISWVRAKELLPV